MSEYLTQKEKEIQELSLRTGFNLGRLSILVQLAEEVSKLVKSIEEYEDQLLSIVTNPQLIEEVD